ncbi:hypothetical protein CRD60_02590 [Bifidobacterium aemilianum]|uniref:ABC transporter domain-containing protein n=1 Tax=Bifidobacterium aemilianum TaxID=2493120 RepID=A0A366KAB3_9BIFI|nr:ATP-binding cassette domain-containing protein [Bifidobacterium aemilianum]RBP98078.1 hypothetical protein CRD60_02590 [Bifidobacterium aemilianum]
MDTDVRQGTMVEADGLAKNFVSGDGSATRVLDVVRFAAGGGMTAIAGPSGCGKSILLYCLSGLEAPCRGSVRVLVEDLSAKDQRGLAIFRRAHIGFVFQSYNLVPAMSVLDNVMPPLTLAGRKAEPGRLSARMSRFRLIGHDDDMA